MRVKPLLVLRYLVRETSPSRRRVSWWDLSEIVLVGFGFLAYFLVRGAVVDRTSDALRNARTIIDFQSALGIWIEPRIQAAVLQAAMFTRAMNFVYFWFDFPLIIAIGLLLFWKQRRHYTLLRDSLLISGGMALIFYWAFPVAPPRYLTEWGFIDTLAKYDQLSYQAQSMRPFVNPFASVPSLHVGWSALLAATLFRASRQLWIRGFGLVVLTLQVTAVVATGNHYFFDATVGLMVCAVAWFIAIWLQGEGYPRFRGWLASRERALSRLEAQRGAR